MKDFIEKQFELLQDLMIQSHEVTFRFPREVIADNLESINQLTGDPSLEVSLECNRFSGCTLTLSVKSLAQDWDLISEDIQLRAKLTTYEETIKNAVKNERTALGRSTLLQLAKNMGIEVEIK